MPLQITLVALGGALGSVLRYLVSVLAIRVASGAAPPAGSSTPGLTTVTPFPWGTLLVNLVGCLAIGLIAAFTAHRHAEGVTVTPFAALDRDAKLFFVTGVLGGFTTFSAFGIETLSLARDGSPARAGVYVAASVLLGLVLAWAGWTLGLRLAPSPGPGAPPVAPN